MALTSMEQSAIFTSPVLPSKRPLPRDFHDKENEGGQSTPRSKRVASGALTDKSNVTASQVAPASKSTAKPKTDALTKCSSSSGNSED